MSPEVHLAYRDPDTGEPTRSVCTLDETLDLTLDPNEVTCIRCQINAQRRWMV